MFLMTENIVNPEQAGVGTHELQICVLQGVARSGKTTISRSLVEAYDFKTIGVGDYFRGITAYYLETIPDQIGAFDPEVFTRFMLEKAEDVQAILNGTLTPSYDLDDPVVRDHVADLGDKTEIIHEVVNEHVCRQLVQMNKDGVNAVFLEGRAWDLILAEKIKQGMRVGRVIANLYIGVSDEVAADRQELKARDQGLPFDREEELARIKRRNELDFNRKRYPMVLPSDAYEIDSPIDTETAKQIGATAVQSVSPERPIPRCIHIVTDTLSPRAAQQITRAIVAGASPELAAIAHE